MKRINEDSKITTSSRAKKEGLRRIPRRHFMKKGETKLIPSKVRVTMYLDPDVLEHFKRRAAEPNAAPYQTQINNELRRLVERTPRSEWSALLNEAVDNQRFMIYVSHEVLREIVNVAARTRTRDFRSFIEELQKDIERAAAF
jgi:uncharacterized protein (DUF4415 family)